MKSLKTIPALLILPLLLAACSGGDEPAVDTAPAETAQEATAETSATPEPATGGTVSAQPDAETDPRIAEGLDFLTGGAGVAVFGRNIVLNVPARDDTTAGLAREVALTASNLSPSTGFTVFVVEDSATATEVPGEGDYLCAVSASENLVQESTC